MRSRLLPFADLNAVLLAIFLVLSLGYSGRRDLLDKEPSISPAQISLSQISDVEPGVDSLFLVSVMSGYAFQTPTYRPTAEMTSKLRLASGSTSLPHPLCSLRIVDRVAPLRGQYDCARQYRDARFIREGQRCVPLRDHPIGAKLEAIREPNRAEISAETSVIDVRLSPSVHFTGFKSEESNGVTIMLESLQTLAEPLEIVGLTCSPTAELLETTRAAIASCASTGASFTAFGIDRAPLQTRMYVFDSEEGHTLLNKRVESLFKAYYSLSIVQTATVGVRATSRQLSSLLRFDGARANTDWVLYEREEDCRLEARGYLMRVRAFRIIVDMSGTATIRGLDEATQ